MAEQTKQRYIYIDLLRGWALLFMLESHVFDAFLATEYMSGPLFNTIRFLHGLIAPTFFFVSGYTFVVVGDRRWNDYLGFKGAYWHQLWRIIHILLIGYMLRIPYFSFKRILTGDPKILESFWHIDVLHLVAATLFFMLLMANVLRSKSLHFVSISVSAIIVMAFTPFVWSWNIHAHLPLGFADYFNASRGSQFPIFPWSAFLLSGGAAAHLMLRFRQRENLQKYFMGMFVAGVAGVVLTFAITFLPIQLYPPHDFFKTNPLFVLLRLSLVFMLMAIVWWWTERFRSGESFVSIIGSNSLIVYSGHLLIIYGMFHKGMSIWYLVGNTQPPWVIVLGAAVMIALMSAIAYVWHRIKKKDKKLARIIYIIVLLMFAYTFFTNEY